MPLVFGVALSVEGESSCPDPPSIAERLQQILALPEDSAPKARARVRTDGSWLVLSLAGADGSTLSERRVALEPDCDVLARTAAVVFAVWLANEHPEFLLPAVRSNGEAMASAHVFAATNPVGTARRGPARKEPARARSTTPTDAAAEPAPNPRLAHRIELSGAVGAGLSGTGVAPAAWLGAAWAPTREGFGARLSAVWIGVRSVPIQDHEVRWTRWPVQLGPYLRLAYSNTSLELEGGMALGWLQLTGVGFRSNLRATDATLGPYAALRFAQRAGPAEAFLAIEPIVWLGRTVATSTEPSSETSLSSIELLYAAGLRFFL